MSIKLGMKFSDLEKMTSYVVDDAGSGRPLNNDPHAIVRRGGVDDFCNRSAFAVFGHNTEKQIVIAVNSYLDAWLSDEEVSELASDYFAERFGKNERPIIERG